MGRDGKYSLAWFSKAKSGLILKNQKGFTGIEVLAFLAIGGLLGLAAKPKEPKICLTQPAFTQMIFQMGQNAGAQEVLLKKSEEVKK